jgi:integral membrane protein
MNFKNLLNQFRLIAFVEGISYLLFALTMPMKYMMGIPGPNKFIGMAHGVLFISYMIWLYLNAMKRKWSLGKIVLLFLASIVPFGTFIADAKILKKELVEPQQ